ncbi:reverse transcriptase domain-containing protein [Thalassobaculum sp. OXR-137]|nr:reverse transcriptase domain-containing protein [Thalassobaculum sp. OXR-137]WPZ33785.1 reverse transcriptase domain-containing protein [Thalassobaculum sp. OXR-137]
MEIRKGDPRYDEHSYGYISGKNIIKNSTVHSRKRFVFNIDLEDFFGSINFGRVRGYFINDHYFRLEPDVATIVAQIACYKNSLPQGSPCSPIISNMIGRILDIRLRDLSKKNNIEYSRYVDDITFSSNEKVFPNEIAFQISISDWGVGERLNSEIERSGFKVNEAKVRMSKRQRRQVVTGLTVNDKPNVRRDFLKYTRAMCDNYFNTGRYFINFEKNKIEEFTAGNVLRGRLSHIYYVQQRKDRKNEHNQIYIDKGEFVPPKEMVGLYRNFLLFSYFVKMEKPIIVTEGKTDILYFKKAIRARSEKYRELGVTNSNGIIEYAVDFFNPSMRNQDLLELGVGVIGQKKLIQEFPAIKRNLILI